MKKLLFSFLAIMFIIPALFLSGCGGNSRTYIDGTFVMTDIQIVPNSKLTEFTNDFEMENYIIELTSEGDIIFTHVSITEFTFNEETGYSNGMATVTMNYYINNKNICLDFGMFSFDYDLKIDGDIITYTHKEDGEIIYRATYTKLPD